MDNKLVSCFAVRTFFQIFQGSDYRVNSHLEKKWRQYAALSHARLCVTFVCGLPGFQEEFRTYLRKVARSRAVRVLDLPYIPPCARRCTVDSRAQYVSFNFQSLLKANLVSVCCSRTVTGTAAVTRLEPKGMTRPKLGLSAMLAIAVLIVLRPDSASAFLLVSTCEHHCHNSHSACIDGCYKAVLRGFDEVPDCKQRCLDYTNSCTDSCASGVQ
ncbi:hypothetical protein LSAT2_008539 [Lamellibrachia satsuma]|nr:hypothetical protein LSAT2_008539 [Lamellibrachia satsuma]